MASPSLASPPSPTLHRDIRSASKPFKRDKDHSSKWINGTRPSAGVREIAFRFPPEDENDKWVGGSASQRAKVRPYKPWSQIASYKSHANKTPKPTTKPSRESWAGNRVSRKIEAQVEAASSPEISRSLMELIPHHVPNTSSSVQTMIHVPDDEGALHFSEASPTKKGRATGLGGLVEKAEERFLDEQTERMVKEDYEVLDVEGESVVLKAEKKRKGSPKQHAAKTDTQLAEEDGFELI